MKTNRTYEALTLLRKHSGLTANRFAELFWGDKKYAYLFTSLSKGFDGGVYGRKAWLCAGSYLSKLARKGLIYASWECGRIGPRGAFYEKKEYKLTFLGERWLRDHEEKHV